ncbi:MAG: M20/M25/M40 family metallo-hydrolase [Flavobacteriaceae bacterium]|nr:M20/M25/M40 family metallo-hydrolase [Flavobacteriaceae bacterium]
MLKKIIGLGIVMSLIACGATKATDDVVEKPIKVVSQSEVDENNGAEVEVVIGDHLQTNGKKASEVYPNDMKTIVSYLASDALAGRDTGSEGIDKAATYIAGYLKENGIGPYYCRYRDVFDVNGKEAFNVIGLLEGTDPVLRDEYVVIGAHYDHIGKGKKVGDDVIANGANDNAAGTAAVMQMAKYFAKVKNNKRSIVFVLFAAEEKGLLGSKHLAKQMKEAGRNVYAMLNFEMIGVPLVGKDYTAYVTGYHKSNLAEKMNAYASANLVGYLPQAKQYQLFSRSDNYPFYTEFNIPAQTFCTFDFTNFDYYHHVDDEIDKLDFNHMASFVNAYLPAIEKVVNSAPNEIRLND